MNHMIKPSPQLLRRELQETTAAGPHEPAVLYLGCVGCTSGQRFVSQLYSDNRLIELMDIAEDIPRAFVSGQLEALGRAAACPMREDSTADCQHAESLQAIAPQIHP